MKASCAWAASGLWDWESSPRGSAFNVSFVPAQLMVPMIKSRNRNLISNLLSFFILEQLLSAPVPWILFSLPPFIIVVAPRGQLGASPSVEEKEWPRG